MKLLVCGPTDWTDATRIYRAIADFCPSAVLHRGQPGADTIAADAAIRWALDENVSVAVIPCDAKRIRREKPDQMLALGPLWEHKVIDEALLIVSPRPSHTEVGKIVAAMLRAEVPVRWIVAHDAMAVDLIVMPEPP